MSIPNPQFLIPNEWSNAQVPMLDSASRHSGLIGNWQLEIGHLMRAAHAHTDGASLG